MPPELTVEEQLALAIIISQDEERRAFPGFKDALALVVAPPQPPGPPPLQPLRTPPAGMEPWGAWPGATPAWPAATPLILGWLPGR
jgi:hypothetical protein